MFTNHDFLCQLSHLIYCCPKDLCLRPHSDKHQRKPQVVYILKCNMYIVFQSVDSKTSGASKTHYAIDARFLQTCACSFDRWLCTIIRHSYRLHRKTALGQFIVQRRWRIMRFSVSQNLQDLQKEVNGCQERSQPSFALRVQTECQGIISQRKSFEHRSYLSSQWWLHKCKNKKISLWGYSHAISSMHTMTVLQAVHRQTSSRSAPTDFFK